MLQTSTYQNLREAVLKRKHVRCRYHGFSRVVCPHVIGWGKEGEEKIFTYQYAGGTSKGALPPGGQWRCMDITEISGVEVFDDGEWRTGSGHSKPQSCVKTIDVQVSYS